MRSLSVTAWVCRLVDATTCFDPSQHAVDSLGGNGTNAVVDQRQSVVNHAGHHAGVAIRVPLIGLPQVAMRIDLHHAKIRIASGMGSDSPKRAGMFPGQGDDKPPDTDIGSDKRLDGIHCLLINFAVKIERANGSNTAPLSIGLTPECFVI